MAKITFLFTTIILTLTFPYNYVALSPPSPVYEYCLFSLFVLAMQG